jgi:hypothetical protein
MQTQVTIFRGTEGAFRVVLGSAADMPYFQKFSFSSIEKARERFDYCPRVLSALDLIAPPPRMVPQRAQIQQAQAMGNVLSLADKTDEELNRLALMIQARRKLSAAVDARRRYQEHSKKQLKRFDVLIDIARTEVDAVAGVQS